MIDKTFRKEFLLHAIVPLTCCFFATFAGAYLAFRFSRSLYEKQNEDILKNQLFQAISLSEINDDLYQRSLTNPAYRQIVQNNVALAPLQGLIENPLAYRTFTPDDLLRLHMVEVYSQVVILDMKGYSSLQANDFDTFSSTLKDIANKYFHDEWRRFQEDQRNVSSQFRSLSTDIPAKTTPTDPDKSEPKTMSPGSPEN